jgi:hypothetical protein
MLFRGSVIRLSSRADALPHRLPVMVTVPQFPQIANPLESTEQTLGWEEAHVSAVRFAVLPSSYVTWQLNCNGVLSGIKKLPGEDRFRNGRRLWNRNRGRGTHVR